MKKFISTICALLLILQIFSGCSNQPTVKEIGNMPIFTPDYKEMVSCSDLDYAGRIEKGSEGIPVANGRFGGPVWHPDGSSLEIQLNHTDCFMYNDASNHTTSEGGALAQVVVNFGDDIFGDDTRSHLSLYDGRLTVEAENVSISIIADNASDTVMLNITDNRETASPITVDLKMLRAPDVKRGDYSAVSRIEIYDTRAVLSQVFSETFDISENNFYCSTAVALTAQGREFEISQPDKRTARLALSEGNGSFSVVLGGYSGMDETADAKGIAAENAASAKSFDEVYTSNQAWWADFWSKSYIELPSHPEYEKRWYYYMYLAAISNRGSYPSKYNGGIWIGEGDRRDWGAWYWNWNQDSLYLPFYEANHAELMEPYFAMRESCYDNYETAARQLWGSEGIFIGETCGILGWETLPEDIAADLRSYYAGEGEKTAALEAYGQSKNAFLTPWNWKISFSGTSVSWVSHTMVATQETAEHFWNYYLYTGDMDWLRDHGYKFISGAAEFYRNYYGFEKGEDGKYHFSRTNLHEHIGGGSDVIDDLSLARGTFAAAIKASELLGTDSDTRALWQECLDNLADYPLASEEGAIAFTENNTDGKKIWAQGRQPSYYLRGLEGTESPKFKMLEKYDVLNLETRDQKRDNGDWQLALNTYFASPGYKNQYLNGEEDKNGSSRFLIDAAKLGRGEELAVMLEAQYKQFSDTPNLMHDEGDYYSAEGYGTFAAALQLALNQSNAPATGEDSVIRVFPAWQNSEDARYKLAAKDGFLVSSSMKSGQIEYIEIESQLGGECRVRLPWKGKADLYINGVWVKAVGGKENELVKFSTEKSDRILLVPCGSDMDSLTASK